MGVIKTWFLIFALSVSFAVQAIAGQFEDAKVAYDRDDYATAIRLLRPLAEQGDAKAQFALGRMYNDGQSVNQDYAEAVKWWRKAADQGNADAQFNLAGMYAQGRGVTQDFAEEVKWTRKAADQGFVLAQSNLGNMYAQGQGVPQDYAEALKWYRKAADQGFDDAQYTLGRMYLEGKGTPVNIDQFLKWNRKAADQGHGPAQFSVAIQLYAESREILNKVDRAETDRMVSKAADISAEAKADRAALNQKYLEIERWVRKAAEQGIPRAQLWLGGIYEGGYGEAKNPVEAMKWYRKAAEQGYGEAQVALAEKYREGRIVAKDDAESAKLLGSAADHGYAPAQYSLGEMYAAGRGVPADSVAAYGWYNLAVSRFSAIETVDRDRAAEARDQVAARLTPAQIAKAQQWVRDWKPVSAIPTNVAAAPPTTPAPPQSRKATPAAVQTPPVITVLHALRTGAESVEISGRVGGGALATLTVDGKAAPFKPDGAFNFRRAVPLGDSEIRLVATNEWGQSAATSISVTRTIAAGTEAGFSPLDPSRHRVKARPNAIALIIGIEQYKSVPPAEFAENDARSFYDYATNALGVPASRVKLLTGADATKVDVEAATLTWLKPQVVKGQTEVFIYFSGHGLASEDGKDLYLLPQDGNRALLDRSALRRKELIEMIVDSGAKSATFFLDTCYSGGTRGKESLDSSARPILIAAKEQSIPPNVTILAAAGNDQLSSSLAAAKHGLFSYFLMKGLEGDAAGSDHIITAAKLEAYLGDHIPSEAAKLGRTQNPQLMGDGDRVISAW